MITEEHQRLRTNLKRKEAQSQGRENESGTEEIEMKLRSQNLLRDNEFDLIFI